MVMMEKELLWSVHTRRGPNGAVLKVQDVEIPLLKQSRLDAVWIESCSGVSGPLEEATATCEVWSGFSGQIIHMLQEMLMFQTDKLSRVAS